MLSCLNPTEAWQDMKAVTPSGKHPVIFSYKEVERLSDGRVFNFDGDVITSRFRPLTVRCGKCVLCKKARAEEIAIRAMLEMKGYEPDTPHAFITLTVDDQHMPDVFPGARLQHRPFQLFMKRLRKAGISCRYLMCGEYGERTHRPHYHAILFGWCPVDSYYDDRGCYHSSRKLEQLWSPTGKEDDRFGNVMVDLVNPNRVFYVAGYTLKFGSDDERWMPYVRWSRRPGLGAAYIDRAGWSQIVKDDVEWFRHEKFKAFYYRTFIGRKEVRFGSRYLDDRLRLTDSDRFDTILLSRQGRVLVEAEKLKESPALAALAVKALMNKANHYRYELARKSRELRPVVV